MAFSKLGLGYFRLCGFPGGCGISDYLVIEMGEVNKITALPVVLDNCEYRPHPVYDQFCDGREFIASEEFNLWPKSQGLVWPV